MTDYLNRLIQRTSGQIPVIKPLVRSMYGTFPTKNEPAVNFEEPVTDLEEQMPVPLHTGEFMQTILKPEFTGNELPLIETEQDKGPEKERTIISKNTKVKDNKVTGNSLKAETREAGQIQTKDITLPIKGPEPVRPNKILPRRLIGQKLVSFHQASKQSTKQQTWLNENVNVPPQSGTEVIVNEAEIPASGDSKKANFPEREGTQFISQPVEYSHRENLVHNYVPETNVKQPPEESVTFGAERRASIINMTTSHPVIQVTIGEVEIRAETPPARQEPRVLINRKTPVISLDDYLKKRDGEK
jgi:hypothetical protein